MSLCKHHPTFCNRISTGWKWRIVNFEDKGGCSLNSSKSKMHIKDAKTIPLKQSTSYQVRKGWRLNASSCTWLENHCKELTSQYTLVFSWIEFCMIQGMLNNLKVACKCNGKVWGMREEKCNSLCLRSSRTFLGYGFCRFNWVLFLNGAIFGEEAPEISQIWVVPKCVSKCP